jgi:hypothetical protein
MCEVFRAPLVSSAGRVHREKREILFYQSQDQEMEESVGAFGDGVPVNRASTLGQSEEDQEEG